jgi:hypothetical protein
MASESLHHVADLQRFGSECIMDLEIYFFRGTTNGNGTINNQKQELAKQILIQRKMQKIRQIYRGQRSARSVAFFPNPLESPYERLILTIEIVSMIYHTLDLIEKYTFTLFKICLLH